MMVADVLAGIGALCLILPVIFIALVWWECHCEKRAERYRAQLRQNWTSSRPERKL
jgi:hypothetical protein